MTKSWTAPPRTAPTTIQSAAGEIAELGGECWADEGTGAGDGGEVVAEEDPFVRWFVVVAIAKTLGGSGAEGVEHHDAESDEAGVEAVAERVSAKGGDDEPDAVDGFAAMEGDGGEGIGGEDGDGGPGEVRDELFRV